MTRRSGQVRRGRLRRRQHARYRDPAWRLDFVRHVVDAKAMAQIQVLGRIHRERSEPAHAPVLAQVLRDLDKARNGLGFHRSIEALRGAEGHMALRYFSALAILAGQDDFHRLPRLASDPFNLLLDIAYSRVAQAMSLALIERGVDLGLGALHADGDGRPTTALDLMEPLRPLMADRWVLSMWRHPNRENWFIQEPDSPRWTLSPAGRTAIRTRWARWQFGSALVVGQMRRITTIVDWWQHALHQPHIPQYSPIA